MACTVRTKWLNPGSWVNRYVTVISGSDALPAILSLPPPPIIVLPRVYGESDSRGLVEVARGRAGVRGGAVAGPWGCPRVTI